MSKKVLSSIWIIVKALILIASTIMLILFTGDLGLMYVLIAIICIYILLELFDFREKHKVRTNREIIDNMLNNESGIDEARKKEGREIIDFSEIVLNKYLGERNEKH